MTDTQQQQAAEQVIINEPVDAPVEVDLEAGKVTPVEAEMPPSPPQRAAPEPQQPERKPLPRPQQRIQTLTHERDSERAEKERLRAELEQARREAAEMRAAKQDAERVGMENHAAKAKSDLAAAKAAFKAAKESQDADAEIEAAERLARATQEVSDADAWIASNPKPQAQPRQPEPREQPRQEQQEQPPLAPNVMDFIAENPWFSVYQMGTDGRPMTDRSGRPISNPDFDPELHDIAMMENRKIEREVRLGTLQRDYIGSPEYFARIASRVHTEVPDAFEADEEQEPPAQPARRAPQMSAPRQPVAPTTRQNPATPKKQGERMRLDGEEAAFVRNLVDSGTMIYPRDHADKNKAGRKMTYDDAYLEYARQKKAQPSHNQQQQ